LGFRDSAALELRGTMASELTQPFLSAMSMDMRGTKKTLERTRGMSLEIVATPSHRLDSSSDQYSRCVFTVEQREDV
jgi:hypothetical protein